MSVMFKPIKWKTFLRDFIVIQLGFAIFGFAIAILIRANLGTSPWVILEVALAQITGLTPGTMSILIGLVVLIGAITMKERIGWGTLGNILFIGVWEDIGLRLIPPADGYFLQVSMLLASVLMIGAASAIYIGVDAGAGPRDSLMLAVKRKTGRSLRLARGSIEIFLVILGWVLGGPIGIGTLIFAILIGPSIQFFFRLLKVEPHHQPGLEGKPGEDTVPQGMNLE